MSNYNFDFRKAYSYMYSFLDSYWEKHSFEDLNILLGSMDPTLWSDGMPMDKGLVADWEVITHKRETITEIEGFSYMLQFLEKQLTWLNLKELVTELSNSLNKKDNNWDLWVNILKSNSNFN